jgi:hypothetical protein
MNGAAGQAATDITRWVTETAGMEMAYRDSPDEFLPA